MNTYSYRSREELERLEQQMLSPFAKRSEDASGTRLVQEEPHPYRTAFQRDRDRIIHSRAFRRLKHKRQVFLTDEGDHYRTRLTHTLEVSQLARTIAKALGLNEELVETIALGHDLGHTPFGHVGETVLHRIAHGEDNLDGVLPEADCGGFKHNYQSLRVVDTIEKKYEYNGLNLTAPVREGILKHTHLNSGIISYPDFNMQHLQLEHPCAATLEGQVVAISDEIAQHTHDLEDGIRAHFVELDEIRKLEIVRRIEDSLQIAAQLPADPYLYRNQCIRGLINLLVSDVLQSSLRNLEVFYERNSSFEFFLEPLIGFSRELEPLHNELDVFIDEEIIFHASIYRADDVATRTIRALFTFYYLYPSQLPDYVLQRMKKPPNAEKPTEFIRTICDYIAGMTDNFAESEYTRIGSIIRTLENGKTIT